jgi:hypothetical protein
LIISIALARGMSGFELSACARCFYSGWNDMGIRARTIFAAAAGTIGLFVASAAFWYKPSIAAPGVSAPVPAAARRAAPERDREVVVALSPSGWRHVSPAHQKVLSPLSAEWGKLAPERRQKWLAIADQYSSMSADAQARVQARMRTWVGLNPVQRNAARKNCVPNRTITALTKSAQWQRYQRLPAAQRAALAAPHQAVPEDELAPTKRRANEAVAQ